MYVSQISLPLKQLEKCHFGINTRYGCMNESSFSFLLSLRHITTVILFVSSLNFFLICKIFPKNRKQGTKQIFVCPYSQQHYLQKPKGRSNQSVYQQITGKTKYGIYINTTDNYSALKRKEIPTHTRA